MILMVTPKPKSVRHATIFAINVLDLQILNAHNVIVTMAITITPQATHVAQIAPQDM